MFIRYIVVILIAISPLLTGCLRSFSLITVNRDGSAVITDTLLFAPRMISMLESMDSGTAASLWSDSTVQADASAFGPGVTVRSIIPLEHQGYKGYVATFDVADITKVTFEKSRASQKLSSPPESGSEAGAQSQTGNKQPLTFSYDKNGNLVINNPMQVDDAADSIQKPKPTPEEQRQSLDMMGGFLRGMHMKICVSVNGAIEHTNARHVRGNTITLMEVDFDKLLDTWEQNIELFSTFDSLKDGDTEAIDRELSKYPPGALVVETQPKVTVTF